LYKYILIIPSKVGTIEESIYGNFTNLAKHHQNISNKSLILLIFIGLSFTKIAH